MNKHEPELYGDILSHVERHEVFTSQQIENYRKKAVKQPKMSKAKAMEEMLAYAFADMKTGRRVIDEISKENRSLADKLAAFTQKLLDGVKNFFTAKEVQFATRKRRTRRVFDELPEILLQSRRK